MPTGNERVPLTALHWGSTPGSGRNLPGVAGCRRAPARGDRADRLEPDRCRASLLERVAPFLRAALLGNVGRCHGRFPCPRSSSSVSCSGCCRRCAVTDGSASGRCCCWRQRRVASRPARGVHGTGRRRGYRYRHVSSRLSRQEVVTQAIQEKHGGGPSRRRGRHRTGGVERCRWADSGPIADISGVSGARRG